MTKIDIDSLHYDMSVVDGRIKRAHDSDAVEQSVRERLLTFQQEWFMDLDQGLPWLTKLTGRSVIPTTLRGYIAANVINTEHVTTVKSVRFGTPTKERNVGIEVIFMDDFKSEEKRINL